MGYLLPTRRLLCRFAEGRVSLAGSVSASQSIASLQNAFSPLSSPWQPREHSFLLLPAAHGQLCWERPSLGWGWAAKQMWDHTCLRAISAAGISQRYMVLPGPLMPSVAQLGRCGLGICMIVLALICRDSSSILPQWHLER